MKTDRSEKDGTERQPPASDSNLDRRSLMMAAVLASSSAALPSAAFAQTAGDRGSRSAVPGPAPTASRRPMNLSGNTILITGGGTGIGRGLAEELHKMGNTVIIASRRRAILEEVAAANPGMRAMTVDVRDPIAVRRFAAELTAAHPALNMVFNNAGIMRREDVKTQSTELADSIDHVETNLNGPIRVTAALLAHLRSRPQALIVNTTSGLAFVPAAIYPTYSATKAALHSYTLSLRRQLRDTEVGVAEIAPPGVQTNLTPGQATNPAFMPLPAFITETMAVLRQQPMPAELLVQRVSFQRRAEAEGRFDASFETMNRSIG